MFFGTEKPSCSAYAGFNDYKTILLIIIYSAAKVTFTLSFGEELLVLCYAMVRILLLLVWNAQRLVIMLADRPYNIPQISARFLGDDAMAQLLNKHQRIELTRSEPSRVCNDLRAWSFLSSVIVAPENHDSG